MNDANSAVSDDKPKRTPYPPLRWYQVWWLVYRHPSADSFERILSDSGVSIRRACAWMVVAAILSRAAGTLLFHGTPPIGVPPPPVASELLSDVLWGGAWGIGGLFACTVIWYMLAMLLGGNGEFYEMIYALGAILAPFVLVVPILIPLGAGFLPAGLAAAGLCILFFFLLVMALRAVDRLSTLRALVVAAVPFLILGGVFIWMMIGLSEYGMM